MYYGDCEHNLQFLNNTINSNETGFRFEFWTNAFNPKILIKSNTINATDAGILFYSFDIAYVNATVNYNRILADIGLKFTVNDAGSNFDYNWWGVNDISGKVIGFDTNNHYILNITNSSSLANVKVIDILNFALLVLNTTLVMKVLRIFLIL